MIDQKGKECWICGHKILELVKPSNLPDKITSQAFSITDSHYGVTAAIYGCLKCGFMQCSDLNNVLSYYEQMEDMSYETNRCERSMQQRKLLQYLSPLKGTGRLLDIGAGSGMLIEQAIKMGYDAEGIEPSVWLQRQAIGLGLPIHQGTFPHSDLCPPYDLITLVDILEHVPNPVDILCDVKAALADDGIGLIITPDVGSLMARLLGFRWWHFRVAHIGYFNRSNLMLALDRADLMPLKVARPGWYFSADYLAKRLNFYLPEFLNFPAPSFLRKFTIPLNMFDSLLILFKRK
ncbi:MAG: class I SAM-dependent methyltransferase [Smithellaceae bacterium]